MKIVVLSSGRNLVHPALENLKLVNHKDRVIVAVALIKIQLLPRLYSVATLDLQFYIYFA